MSWESVETAQCERCGIYTKRSDLVFGPDGKTYCCGVPPEARRVADAGLEWSARRPHPTSLARTTRLVIAAMLVLTFAFPLAACCSQL